jgi:hypothetical protein
METSVKNTDSGYKCCTRRSSARFFSTMSALSCLLRGIKRLTLTYGLPHRGTEQVWNRGTFAIVLQCSEPKIMIARHKNKHKMKKIQEGQYACFLKQQQVLCLIISFLASLFHGLRHSFPSFFSLVAPCTVRPERGDKEPR